TARDATEKHPKQMSSNNPGPPRRRLAGRRTLRVSSAHCPCESVLMLHRPAKTILETAYVEPRCPARSPTAGGRASRATLPGLVHALRWFVGEVNPKSEAGI